LRRGGGHQVVFFGTPKANTPTGLQATSETAALYPAGIMMKKVLFAAISRVSRQQLSSLCRRRQCSRSAQGAIAAVIDYYWPTQLALKCAFGLWPFKAAANG